MDNPGDSGNNPADALRELARKITDSLPASMQQAQQDIESGIHAMLQSSLAKMNLVTREEFDIQAALLERTREKLDRLEKQIEAMEMEDQAKKE